MESRLLESVVFPYGTKSISRERIGIDLQLLYAITVLYMHSPLGRSLTLYYTRMKLNVISSFRTFRQFRASRFTNNAISVNTSRTYKSL